MTLYCGDKFLALVSTTSTLHIARVTKKLSVLGEIAIRRNAAERIITALEEAASDDEVNVVLARAYRSAA